MIKIYALCVSILLLMSGSLYVRAQTPAPPNAIPLCKPADIDTTFDFAETPKEHQSITIHLRNAAAQSCELRGELSPSFAIDGLGARIDTCWLCTSGDHSDTEAVKRNDSFMLPSQVSAHVTYSWSSVGDSCQRFAWATIGTEWDGRANFLFQNMHWKPNVCSVMQISGYELDSKNGEMLTHVRQTALNVTPPALPIYEDEFAKLTLGLASASTVAGPTGHCPELYAVYNDASGSTRFEAILPDGYGALVRNASDQPNVFISGYSDDLPADLKGYTRVCDAQGKRPTTTVSLPASLKAPIHVVPTPNLKDIRHIVWRAENTSTHEPVFTAADVHFEVLDPDSLPQNWGPEIAGIGVGLSVDRTTFTYGEEIPLHLRWENFSASKKLGVTECGDPQPQVEVQDQAHRVIGVASFPDYGCMGHGWGPFAIEQGKRHREYASLTSSKMGYMTSEGKALIAEPGIYYLSAVWSTSSAPYQVQRDRAARSWTAVHLWGALCNGSLATGPDRDPGK